MSETPEQKPATPPPPPEQKPDTAGQLVKPYDIAPPGNPGGGGGH